MSDKMVEHMVSGENKTITPHPDTGISFVNKEAQDAETLHNASAEIGGKVVGNAAPLKNFGSLNHNQFEAPPQIPKLDASTLTPEDRKGAINDTKRWFAELVHGRGEK
jgi:hypothetical protein